MTAARPFAVILLLAAAALAGCAAEAPQAPPPAEGVTCLEDKLCGDALLDPTGRDLRIDLLATDEAPAPQWEVGDVFEQHVYYGTKDKEGEHIQTMVVDDAGDCYQFGTTSAVAARTEATFDLPVLGCIGKDHLATSAFGVDWDWMYDFPLADGKTWTGSIQGIFNWNRNSFESYNFTLTAAYAASSGGFFGKYPGFSITGTTDEGETLLSYDFVPAVGWFTHFYMYDLSTEDADDIMFHAMSMGTWKGYEGPYFIDEGVTVIDSFYMPPLSVVAGYVPQAGFTVPQEADYLKGVVVPIACVGTSKVVLVSPDTGQRHYEHTYTASADACVDEGPNPATYSVGWFDEEAQPGDWRIVQAGAGLTGYYVWLVAVTEHEHQLAAAAA